MFFVVTNYFTKHGHLQHTQSLLHFLSKFCTFHNFSSPTGRDPTFFKTPKINKNVQLFNSHLSTSKFL